MLANPEVSVALDSLDKKPTGFAIGFWITCIFEAPPQKFKMNKNIRAPKNEM